MTVQEAIDLIKQVPLYRYECELEKGRQSDLYKALYLSIEALEKQIPKKPKESDYSIIIQGICPVCGLKFFVIYSYCPECGQKLDWSEEE